MQAGRMLPAVAVIVRCARGDGGIGDGLSFSLSPHHLTPITLVPFRPALIDTAWDQILPTRCQLVVQSAWPSPAALRDSHRSEQTCVQFVDMPHLLSHFQRRNREQGLPGLMKREPFS